MKFVNLKKCIWTGVVSLLLCLITTFQAMAAPYVTMKLTSNFQTYTYTAEEVYLEVNGQRLNNLTMPPIIVNGSTLVPAREVFEKLGARVAWKEATQEIDILYNNIFVMLYLNKNTAVVAGNTVKLSTPPQLINNKTMIPLRFVGEAIGLDVSWNDKTRIAAVNTTTTTTSTTSTTTTSTTTTSTTSTTTTTTTTTTETTTEATTLSHKTISTGKDTKTSITNILQPTGNSNSFSISASSSLSDVWIYDVKGNQLVLDIINSTNMIKQSSFSVNHPYVSAIQVTQYEENPTPITRVTMTIQPNANFDIDFSEDKTNVIIKFDTNSINDIEATASDDKDLVKISGSTKPNFNISKSSDGSKIIVDLPYSNLNKAIDTLKVDNLIDTVTYSQFTVTSVRVVINLKDTSCNFTSSLSENSVLISISKNASNNSSNNNNSSSNNANHSGIAGFDSSTHTLALEKGHNSVGISSIEENDNYNSLSYSFTFPANYSATFGTGESTVDDTYIKGYSISHTDFSTTVTIDEKQIMAYEITEDSKFYYISAVLPKTKYKNILVLDAGHGGSDVGAVGNGLYEKNLTLDIVNKAVALFEKNDNVKVYAIRTTDVYPTLKDRVNYANPLGDIFVSVHINSAASTGAYGTEVYYQNSASNSSGLTSRMLAEKTQSKLLEYLGSYDRKVKTADFYVIRYTTIPAILCEIGFISNPSEAAKMGTDDYRQKAAQAIYESVSELLVAYPCR